MGLKNDFTTRESRETGRFNENQNSPVGLNQREKERGIDVYSPQQPEGRSKSNDETFLCGSSKRNVVRLLEEARKLQVKHQRIMSRSKGRSSDISGSPLRVSAGSGMKSPARNHTTNIMRVKQPLRDRSEESRSNEKRK